MTKKKLIISIIVLIMITSTILYITYSNKNKDLQSNYYTGTLLSPNYSANLIDGISSKENIIISPYNLVSSLAVLYNGSDNNTSKEIKKYLSNTSLTLEDLLIPTLNDLSEKKEYDFTTSKYYESIIQKIDLSKYENYIINDIKNLNTQNKQNLLLLLKQAKMSYELLLDPEKYTLDTIKTTSLSKTDLLITDNELLSILNEVIEEYSSYTTRNTIVNSHLLLINKNTISSLDKTYIKNIEKYNPKIYYYDNKTDIKKLNEELKQTTYYNFYLDDNILNNNFIYFNSLNIDYNFLEEFDSSNTYVDSFNLLDNTSINANTIHSEIDYYYENSFAYAIEKKFQNDNFSFFAILPKDIGNLELSKLSLNTLLKSKKNKEAYISLPKFSYTKELDIKNVLSNNFTDLFSDKVNLSKMSNKQLLLDTYNQKISFSLGEKGTNNSKINKQTTIDNNTSNIKILFNRPFAILIRDNKTNNILLIGKILNPNK